MVLTRAQNQPGPDGVLQDRAPTNPGPRPCTSLNVPAGCDESADDIQNANNTDSPVGRPEPDLHLARLAPGVPARVRAERGQPSRLDRQAARRPARRPDLPELARRAATGIGTWAAVKKQAAEKLGLLLVDKDVTNIPMIAADPYGKFIPGPLRGLPQYVTDDRPGRGQPRQPRAGAGERALLRHAVPDGHRAQRRPDPAGHRPQPGTPPVAPTPDADNTPSADFANQPAGTYDDEMLNAHFACGDGRCNENIALSTIHQVFHSEHDRLVDYIKGVLTADTSATGVTALAQWKLPVAQSPDGWNGERLFQAARFVTEMEYQHLVFEEFARKVQPAVRPFHVYSPDINPAVEAEFAHAVYRFGHSMLDDDVARTTTNPDGSKTDNSLPLLTAFLNPPEYFNNGQRRLLHARAGGRRHRHGLVRPGRQRARRVRDRDAPQQPAGPAARPAHAQHDAGS